MSYLPKMGDSPCKLEQEFLHQQYVCVPAEFVSLVVVPGNLNLVQRISALSGVCLSIAEPPTMTFHN